MVQRENIGRVCKSNASYRKAERHMRTRAEERAEIAARLKLGPVKRAQRLLLERLGFACRHVTRHDTIELDRGPADGKQRALLPPCLRSEGSVYASGRLSADPLREVDAEPCALTIERGHR